MAETPVKEPPAEEKARTAQAPAEEAKTEKTETREKSGEKPSKKKKKALVLILLLLLIGAGVFAYFYLNREDDNGIPYAEGVVLYGGEEIEPVEEGWMKLSYNHQAHSSDGVNFTCFLTNDPANVFDMYFDIYADDTLEDRVFLSGLLRPGYALTSVVLDRALPAGTTTCYVVFNQVATDEAGNQTIVNQMLVTVDFIVE